VLNYPDHSSPNLNTTQYQLEFNICEKTFSECQGENKTFAHVYDFQSESCQKLSTEQLSEVGVALYDEEDPEQGVTLSYHSKGLCNETHKNALIVNLICEKDTPYPLYSFAQTPYEQGPCEPLVVNMETAAGCPVISLHALQAFLEQYYVFFGVLLILIGFWMLIFGGQQYKILMFLECQLILTIFFMCILYAFLYPPSFTEEYIVWLSLLGCLVVGGGCGYVASEYWKVGLFFIGAWIGGLLGGFLYGLIIYLAGNENPTLVLWVTIVLSALFVALIAIKCIEYIAIVGSALVGSYFLVRGISLFAGGYPNELLLYQIYENNSIVSATPAMFFVYLGVMVVLAIGSIIFQYLRSQKHAEAYNYRDPEGHSKGRWSTFL